MAIACPHCDHWLNLKDPKPGRFRPRCPKCVRTFALVVPAEPGAPCTADRLPDDTRPSAPRAKLKSHQPAAAPVRESQRVGFAPTNPDPAKEPEFAPPRTDVRGYRIERELGRGGMGAVYLARQLSLDRPVALKVMARRWAADPVFVARFTREAYAAAQLRHPNIVHIHDIGEVDGCRFFSMEYVPGRSLAEVLKRHGKLDPETAVGYVLQAARGLKHAHDRGMIHRDVKPDNLLLDDQGLVKVADLGLVKTGNSECGIRTEDNAPTPDLSSIPQSEFPNPRSGLTGAKIALGTPAYMSPEQCRDAASVDHRADVYSLGCTLYVLVTGRPPFDGTTAVELMTKHAYEPVVPPEQIVSRVPRELSAVIQRMMAKNAADRFADMAEVIRTLEAWLGVRTAGGFSPKDDQIDQLERYAAAFHTARTGVLRGRILQGFAAVLALAVVLLVFFGKAAWASGLVGLACSMSLSYFVLDGVCRRGPLFTRARQFAFGLGWTDWAIAVAGLALFGLVLGMFGVFWVWAGFGLIGVGLAFALRYGLDRRLDAERRPALDGCEKLLRRLRAQGLAEDDLRVFVAKFAGRHWEEFHEALFGYAAKLDARAVLMRGGFAGPRERHAAWREPLIALVDRVERARKEARERRLLAAVEQARLQAAGVAQQEAENKAKAAAAAMVREADKIRKAEAERVRIGRPETAAVATLTRGSSDPDFAFAPAPAARGGGLVGLFVGPHVRAAAAAVLLAGCGLWANQNGLLPGPDATGDTTPLAVDGVPAGLTGWVDGFNVGLAGLLLLGSLCYRGNTMSVFALLGAGVAVAGHRLGVRPVDPLRADHVALLLGTVLALVGFRNGTR